MADKYTDDFKKKVVEEYTSGATPSELSNKYGVHRNSILKWAKKHGVDARVVQKNRNSDTTENPVKPRSMTLTEMRAMRHQAEVISAESVAKAASSPADAYNSYMAETVMNAIQSTADSMPRVKSWADFERANKIMRQALGLDVGNSKSGVGGRISLDVNIINGKTKSKAVDAEIIENKSCGEQ